MKRLHRLIWLGLVLCCFSLKAHAVETAVPQLLDVYEYKPIYFVVGHPYAKLELSAKTPVVHDVPIYFAYTQLMFWDIFNPSPAFRDLNYNPEAFYRFMVSVPDNQWWDFGPFDHESNGLGVNGERAWDRVYLRYHTMTRLRPDMNLHWNLSIWFPYDYGVNLDLPQYRGIWEMDVTLTDFFGHYVQNGDLRFRLYPGGPSLVNPFLGGQEVTLRAKLTTFFPLMVFQLFHGYAENLLDYKENRFAFRVGIGF